MSQLVVISCGAGVSLQDGGRFGSQRYGVSPAGAMDRDCLRLANALVGNAQDMAALEFTLMGGTLRAEGGPCRLALVGSDASLSVDGEIMPHLTSITVEEGQTVTVGPARSGISMVLAVAGGFALAPQLGSLSLHKRAGIGGLNGKALAPGDTLPLKWDAVSGPELTLDHLPHVGDGPFHVVMGPQDDYFTENGIKTFLNETYVVSAEADRMGFRLTGPKIEHAQGFNIVSDGIASGAVQVPGTGEPIVLLADRQTTGGYPKIATLISSDLGRFANQRPGTKVRFTAISRDEAIARAKQKQAAFARLVSQIRPVSASLDSERLLSLQLIDGFIAE